jgi:hypothetical protein
VTGTDLSADLKGDFDLSRTHTQHEPVDPQRGTFLGCFFFPVVLAAILVASWYWSTQYDPGDLTDWVKLEYVFHDNLSRSLEQGRGFELDFEDAAWMGEYSKQNTSGRYDWMFSVDAVGPTTAHSPAVPFLMSLSRRFLGGDQTVLWGASALLFACALTILVRTTKDTFGWPAALIAACILLVDMRLQQSSGLYSGEGLVAALIVLAFVLAVKALNRNNVDRAAIWLWPMAGGLLGAATLLRIEISLWFLLLLAVWLGSLTILWIRGNSLGQSLESFALFSIGVLVVSAPWWIHNCKTTGQFKPFGESLSIMAIGGYSDAAFRQAGNLDAGEVLRNRTEALRGWESADNSLVHKEATIAGQSVSRSRVWIEENPAKLPLLVMMKIGNHLGLIGQAGWNWGRTLVWAGALLGICVSWRRFGIVVFAVVLASVIITGLTWSDHGRLFAPLRPLIDVSFAVGLIHLVRLVRRRALTGPQVQP